MLRSHPPSKAYTSPHQSHISALGYYDFPLSEQLDSSYVPNYKKLSSFRKKNHSQPIRFSALLDPQRIQIIIEDSLKLKSQICELCETTYHQRHMSLLCNCKHQYCENCLIQYVNFKINSMEEIRCPNETCDQKVNLQGDIYKNLPEQLKKKYKKAQLWRQTIANPDLKLCPIEQCEGQVQMKLIPPQCTICHRYFCSQCMNEKHEGNCDKQLQLKHRQWRRCPNCRMFINKIQGCNHITCLCHNEFCFVCLQKWDSTHYKCQEKEQMYYLNMDEVKHPMLIVALMIAFFPVFLILAMLAVMVSIVVMIAAGALMGMGYTLMKLYWLCCIVLVLIPFGALIGAIVIPITFLAQKAIPEFIHHFRRYKITFNQLILKISEPQSH